MCSERRSGAETVTAARMGVPGSAQRCLSRIEPPIEKPMAKMGASG